MNNLGLLLRKYSVPAIFTIVGFAVLIYGFSNGQSGTFLFASAMMLAAGVLSGLFSMGKLTPPVVVGTGIGFGIIALILIYLSYDSVSTTRQYERDRDQCMEMAKQNLTDIRFLQKVHKDQYGTYISDWNELIDFAENGTMMSLVQKGSVPKEKITPEERDYLYGDNRAIDNNMTEEEAILLAKWEEGPRYNTLFAGFVRDTVQVSIMKTKFKNKAYTDSRKKSDLGPFSAKDLPYIPYTKKEKWKIEIKDSITIGEMTGPAILVSGKIPFAELEGTTELIEMFFGNLSTFDMEGSWEIED